MSTVPLASAHAPVPADKVASLERAFSEERTLLERLLDTLGRQRGAVARNDLTVLDDTVFAAQRILLSLAQARRRRASLVLLLVGEEEMPLAELPDALGEAWTPGLEDSVEDLRAVAGRVAQALEQNRRVLDGAMATGDKMIRTLCGADRPRQVYGPGDGDGDGAGGGRLIDQQV